jgi:hypothetical protein
LGRFPSPVPGDFYLVHLLALPGAGDDCFVLLLWGEDHIGGLFLVDLAQPSQPAVWRLTAPSVNVDDVQLRKDALVYLTAPPPRHERRDPVAQLHALPLGRLDRDKVAADPAFSRLGGR